MEKIKPDISEHDKNKEMIKKYQQFLMEGEKVINASPCILEAQEGLEDDDVLNLILNEKAYETNATFFNSPEYRSIDKNGKKQNIEVQTTPRTSIYNSTMGNGHSFLTQKSVKKSLTSAMVKR